MRGVFQAFAALATLAALAVAATGGPMEAVVGLAALAATLSITYRRLGQRQQRDRGVAFRQWAQAHGLEYGRDGIDLRPFEAFAYGRGAGVDRAASRPGGGGSIAVVEWSVQDDRARPVRRTGVLLPAPKADVDVLLRPGKPAGPHLPLEVPRFESGNPALDRAYTILCLSGEEPAWVDHDVAEALIALARWDASIDVRDRRALVALPCQPETGRYGELLEAGMHLADAWRPLPRDA